MSTAISLCSHCREPERLVGPCHFAPCGWLCQTCFDGMITLAQLAQTGEANRRLLTSFTDQ